MRFRCSFKFVKDDLRGGRPRYNPVPSKASFLPFRAPFGPKSVQKPRKNKGCWYVGPSCSHLALIFHLGAILGPSWAVLGPSWSHLGAILGVSWAILGHLGAVLGPSWGPLGSILGPSWSHLGALLGPPWALSGPPGGPETYENFRFLYVFATSMISLFRRPRCLQADPKMAPRGPKIAPRRPQDGAKMAP